MQVLKDGDHIHQLFHGDCLDVMQGIPAGSVDMIFADLPYGMTHNDWDRRIPLEDYVILDGDAISRDCFLLAQYRAGVPYAAALAKFREQKRPGLWSHYLRIIKDNGASHCSRRLPLIPSLVRPARNGSDMNGLSRKHKPPGISPHLDISPRLWYILVCLSPIRPDGGPF